MDRLTQDGIYIRIGFHARAIRSGGAFEIYWSKSDDSSPKSDRVNDVIQNENFSFINSNRLEKGLNMPILQRHTRQKNEFDEQSYLIREKNTLRLPNPDECQKLDEVTIVWDVERLPSKIEAPASDLFSLPQECVDDIMRNSYGRMAMTNQRARNRYDTLVAIYNEIFNFDLRSQKVKITAYSSRDNDENNFTIDGYDKIYYLTVKDGDSQKHLLKKVLETLQVYNSSNTNSHFDENHNRIDGTIPLLVSLNIGGKLIEFMLSPWPMMELNTRMNQVLVSTEKSTGMFQGNTYTYWCGQHFGFGSYPKGVQQLLAECLLECLNAPVSQQPNVFQSYLKSSFVSNIVQFLVATQTVEACYGRNANYARTMGMNKLARKQLRSIEKGASTFSECFTLKGHEIRPHGYPPAGQDGTKTAREAVSKVTKMGVECYDMSDDSD